MTLSHYLLLMKNWTLIFPVLWTIIFLSWFSSLNSWWLLNIITGLSIIFSYISYRGLLIKRDTGRLKPFQELLPIILLSLLLWFSFWLWQEILVEHPLIILPSMIFFWIYVKNIFFSWFKTDYSVLFTLIVSCAIILLTPFLMTLWSNQESTTIPEITDDPLVNFENSLRFAGMPEEDIQKSKESFEKSEYCSNNYYEHDCLIYNAYKVHILWDITEYYREDTNNLIYRTIYKKGDDILDFSTTPSSYTMGDRVEFWTTIELYSPERKTLQVGWDFYMQPIFWDDIQKKIIVPSDLIYIQAMNEDINEDIIWEREIY